jgi:hypothetical protein
MSSSSRPSQVPRSAIEEPARLDPQHPWPGLAPYDELSRHYFQGRDEEADRLVQLIESAPVVSLYGKSGLGKSSLLRAGLFPRLRSRRFLPVYARLDFTAEGSPWDQVIALLIEAAEAASLDWPVPAQGETLWHYLHRRDFELWTQDNYPVVPVLVLDQFEEFFSRTGRTREELGDLLNALGDLAENRLPPEVAADRTDSASLDLSSQRYRMVISFREDYLPELRTFEPRLPSLLRQSLRLMPMSRERAIEAVRKAGAAVLAVGVAQPIVDFVAGLQDGSGKPDLATVEPVLLSLCCTQLNRRRAPGGKINTTLVAQAGPDILQDFYSDAMKDLPESVHRFVEDHLIQGDRTRGSYALDAAIEQGFISTEQLNSLTGVHRVLRIEPQGDVPRIELIHDRLVAVVRGARDLRRTRLQAEETRQRELAARDRRGKQWLALALSVVSLLAAVSVAQTVRFQRAAERATQASQAASRNAEQAREASIAATAAREEAVKATNEAKARLRQVTLLATYGWIGADGDPALLDNAVNADTFISALLDASTTEDRARRSRTVLEIWAKDVDQGRVKQSLKSLGFATTERKAKLPNLVTNAVFFGKPVRADDVKLVVLALMRAGVQIQTIRSIQGIAASTQPVIQAGTSAVSEQCPPWTARQVMDAKSFEPGPKGCAAF